MNRPLAPWKAWGLFALCALVWGSSFILMKRGLAVYSPLQVALLRVVVAGLCTLPFAVFFLRKFHYKVPYGPVLVTAWAGSVVPALLYTLAVQGIGSGVAGVLNSTTGLMTFVLGILLFRQPFVNTKLAGVLLGMAGAAALIALTAGAGAAEMREPLLGLLPLAATTLYGYNANFARARLGGFPPLATNSIGFTLGCVPLMLPLFFATDFTDRLQHAPGAWPALGFVCILGAVGTALTMGIAYFLIQRKGPLFAASITYAIPVVALLWAVVDGETIGWEHLLCMGGILAGVWLVNRK